MMSKRSLIRNFLIKALIFFIVWKVVFYACIIPTGANNFITEVVSHGTKLGGRLLGYTTRVEIIETDDSISRVNGIVYFDEVPGVMVADACNGLELFALYVGFFVCFPGSVLPKILFSVGGTLLLFTLNIMREVVLAINYMYFETSFDFNHKYTYAIAVYLVVFLIWKYWLNNYSMIAKKKNEFKN